MNDNFISRIPTRYWAYLSLLAWGGVTLFLLRHDSLSLDEGAAKSLLLLWSVADHVASSVVTFGAPDFRILLFIPVGFLWTGNVFAAKVLTVLSLAFAAWLLYAWEEQKSDSESALFATGLLIISPLLMSQIDRLSPGIFLLLSFVVGAWLDKTYRANPSPFGGWYFAQLFVCAISVSIHPAGLAYPLALLWAWKKQPLNLKQQKYFFIGVGLVVLATVVITLGWHDLQWLQNPFKSLSAALLGHILDNEMTLARWFSGIVVLLLLLTVIIRQHRIIWADLTGRTLLLGLFLGAANFDTTWAIIPLSIILYYGLPLLLSATPLQGGFFKQRGVALLLIIIVSTLFMRADRAHYENRLNGVLSGQDILINAFSAEVESGRKVSGDSDGKISAPRLRIASQWPSRTMIACKCDTLPLPPAAKNAQDQLKMLRTITHLMFDPKQAENILLARNLAALNGDTAETILLQPEGVLLHFKNTSSVDLED